MRPSRIVLALVPLGAALAAIPVRPAIAQQVPSTDPERDPDRAMLVGLGKLLFNDKGLSNPTGQACASCHDPDAGFRFPDSRVNAAFGVSTGAIPTRVTGRSAPTVSYARYIPDGPPFAHFGADLGRGDMGRGRRNMGGELVFIGGMFWDGHANTLEHQATFPFQNPNEMNDLVHEVGSPGLVVRKVLASRYVDRFREVFGHDVFRRSIDEVFAAVCQAIAAYERSAEVSPFSSRFDAFVGGGELLTPEELDGLRLMTGTWSGKTVGRPYRKNAQCIACHGIQDDPSAGPSLWTFFCYANIGVPRNPQNPIYRQTDPVSNPVGYNPLGEDYVDLGLGDYLYPLNGLPRGNRGPGSNGAGDFLAINGAFKAPTLRNVDKRPYPAFVKSYMHNGAFRSLKEVVHFYNTRNLTTVPGEVIDFDLPDPYAGLRGVPLWPKPEYPLPSSLVNPAGDPGANGGQVGNLGLTDEEEDHVVAFLRTLSDGYATDGR
jgi:cytochrome c peroxidase